MADIRSYMKEKEKREKKQSGYFAKTAINPYRIVPTCKLTEILF